MIYLITDINWRRLQINYTDASELTRSRPDPFSGSSSI